MRKEKEDVIFIFLKPRYFIENLCLYQLATFPIPHNILTFKWILRFGFFFFFSKVKSIQNCLSLSYWKHPWRVSRFLKKFIWKYKLILTLSYDSHLGTGGSDGKESTCNAGDPGSFPGSGKSPGEVNSNPFQYSCLENPWTEETGGLLGLPIAALLQHHWTSYLLLVLNFKIVL